MGRNKTIQAVSGDNYHTIFLRLLLYTVFIVVQNSADARDRILQHMVKVTRKNAGLEENPIVALVDSQSVQNSSASEQSGYDAGKKNLESSDKLPQTK